MIGRYQDVKFLGTTHIDDVFCILIVKRITRPKPGRNRIEAYTFKDKCFHEVGRSHDASFRFTKANHITTDFLEAILVQHDRLRKPVRIEVDECGFAPSWTVSGLYALLFEMSHTIKIGRAINIAKRITGLSGSGPEPCRFVAAIHTDNLSKELAIHRDLSEHRLRGEWFHDNDRVREYIRQHFTVVDWRF